jgi:hypothetical protein
MAEDIPIEMIVEELLSDLLQKAKLVSAGVVDQRIEPAEGAVCLAEKASDARLFGDVDLHGNRLAAETSDFLDDLVRLSWLEA